VVEALGREGEEGCAASEGFNVERELEEGVGRWTSKI